MSERFAVQSPRRRRSTTVRTRPSVLAREPRRILQIMAIVSIVAHAALILFLHDRPLGFVDADALRDAPQPMRVKRATYDLVTDAGRSADESATDNEPSEAEVADALLDEQTAEAPAAPEAPRQDLALRDLEERAPQQATEQLAAAIPGFKLPDSTLAAMSGPGPSETAGGTGDGGEGEGAGNGNGAGGGDGNASAASAAQQLLAEASASGAGDPGSRSGGGSEPPVLERRELPDTAPRDQRLLETPLASSGLDFTHALDATTELDVPEHLDQDFEYHLTRHEPDGERGYFRVDIVPRRSLRKLQTMPKDVVFLVDTSSSIPQEWVHHINRGVSQGLSALNEGDRFNIVLFNEQPAFFSREGNQPATAETIAEAKRWLSDAEAIGWTDVNAALSQLLVRDTEDDRVYDIVLISDGIPTRGMLDTRELINVITRDNDLTASIYCVGVGPRQNRELLEFLAYRNKGFCRFVDERGEAAGAVRALMSQIRYPLIKNAQLRVAGSGVSEIYPAHLPNIHQGERLLLFGRYVAPEPFTVEISGRNGAQAVDFTFTRDLRRAPGGEASIATDWAFWKLHHLYSRIIHEGETETIQAQIDQLRRRYDLETLY